MRHPSMTTRGVRIAFAVAVLVVLLLPKQSPCHFPGEDCSVVKDGRVCTTTEVEPFGAYLLERLLQRDVGVAYSESADCP
jgi:hypothetical protein